MATAQQILGIQQWELTAATIPDPFERAYQAELRFGNDPAFIVWPDGTVTLSEINGPTFDQGAGINRTEYVARHGYWFAPLTGQPPE